MPYTGILFLIGADDRRAAAVSTVFRPRMMIFRLSCSLSSSVPVPENNPVLGPFPCLPDQRAGRCLFRASVRIEFPGGAAFPRKPEGKEVSDFHVCRPGDSGDRLLTAAGFFIPALFPRKANPPSPNLMVIGWY